MPGPDEIDDHAIFDVVGDFVPGTHTDPESADPVEHAFGEDIAVTEESAIAEEGEIATEVLVMVRGTQIAPDNNEPVGHPDWVDNLGITEIEIEIAAEVVLVVVEGTQMKPDRSEPIGHDGTVVDGRGAAGGDFRMLTCQTSFR